MNEKTRVQIENMKKQTIGVEIEFNGMTRERPPEWLQSTSAPNPTTRRQNTAT